MADTKHGLQETKGLFQIRGIVNGVEKENFYTEKKTKTGKDWRSINFGLEIEPNKSVYLNLNGMVRDDVYFSANKDGKTVVEKVAWSKRNDFNKEGYSLIGIRLGLTKDDEGKNIKETLTDFDACEKIHDVLEDGMSIFAQGKIEFSSYEGQDGGKKRTIKFVPQQMFLCSKDIDFSDDEFEVKADFRQQIVYMGIDKVEDHFVVKAKIITYDSIEDTEFIIEDASLANMFKKKLKPYNAIQVHGYIKVTENVDEVEEDDDIWGESDPTQRIVSPTRRDLVITGAKGKTVDTTTYSEKLIEEAIQKLNQSASAQEDWGSNSDVNDVNDEEW